MPAPKPNKEAILTYRRCLEALNQKNEKIFFDSLSRLHTIMSDQLYESKSIGPDPRQAYLAELQKQKIELNETGLEQYSLYFHIAHFCFNRVSILLSENPEKSELRLENRNYFKDSIASEFIMKLYPRNDNFVNHFTDAFHLIDYKENIRMRFPKINESIYKEHQKTISAKLACLVYLKKELNNSENNWKRQGKTFLGCLPLIACCLPSFVTRKTPRTVKQLKKQLKILPGKQSYKDVESLFSTVSATLFQTTRHKPSSRTERIHHTWMRLYSDIVSAENGKEPWLNRAPGLTHQEAAPSP